MMYTEEVSLSVNVEIDCTQHPRRKGVPTATLGLCFWT